MKNHIFREYDIRGIVPAELNQKTVYELGRGIGSYYQKKAAGRISVGRDCRLSSPDISEWLIKGLIKSGIEVIDIGMVPTPMLYYSLHRLEVDGGIQITGSHNPPEFNGFKICLDKMSVYGEEIRKIRNTIESGDFTGGQGKMDNADITGSYIQYIEKNIKAGHINKKVVIDGGNGVGGPIASEIYSRLGFEIIPLFCEPDGRFPNHHPDPTIPENLKAMMEKISETSADIGIAFDGDADRIGVVDQVGKIIWGDQLMIIFARDLLKRHPGAEIIGDVKCSQALYDDIERHGGKAVMWKTGHSLIKDKMKEDGALFAGEMSGHIFFSERYFGYDDAIYAGARLLEILSQGEKSLGDLLSDVPKMINTPEIRMDCPDNRKFDIVTALVEEFKKNYEVIDIDGARVILDGGWGLIRASNTQPVLVLRFEAENEKRLKEIQELFMTKLNRLY